LNWLVAAKKICQRDNVNEDIFLKEIPGAGHYPWFENPTEVILAFQEYFRKSYENI
jgi:pimeloyl-ACP methyl ester carboxylesterase